MRTTKEDIIYLAGFTDGEGWLGFSNTKTKYDKVKMSPRITIVNTNKEVIEWMHKKFGGWILFQESNNIKWKHSWKWHISGWTRVTTLLKDLSPYLKVKRKQAEVILTANSDRQNLKYYRRIRCLNKKGR